MSVVKGTRAFDFRLNIPLAPDAGANLLCSPSVEYLRHLILFAGSRQVINYQEGSFLFERYRQQVILSSLLFSVSTTFCKYFIAMRM